MFSITKAGSTTQTRICIRGQVLIRHARRKINIIKREDLSEVWAPDGTYLYWRTTIGGGSLELSDQKKTLEAIFDSIVNCQNNVLWLEVEPGKWERHDEV